VIAPDAHRRQNGHITPHGLQFIFPTIVDGFMVMGSGVMAPTWPN
jgi:hypothetical protein